MGDRVGEKTGLWCRPAEGGVCVEVLGGRLQRVFRMTLFFSVIAARLWVPPAASTTQPGSRGACHQPAESVDAVL